MEASDCSRLLLTIPAILGLGVYLPMILFGWYLSRENRLDRIEMSKRISELESKIDNIKYKL